MASVAIRKEGTEQPSAPVRRPQSPFNIVRDLMRWDPFADLAPAWIEQSALFVPDFDVKETKDAFVFTADIPGVKTEDLEVKTSQNRLTVSGKKEEEKEEKTDTMYRRERSFGRFTRSFTMPDGTDSERIAAELKNGVLTLTLPKRPEAKSKQVSVKAG